MNYDEFLRRVQENANLEDRAAAERVTEATLATLGERLYRTTVDNFSAPLAKPLQAFFYQRQPPENTRQEIDRFDLEEFYTRVSARAGVGFQQARQQAGAVVAVLEEALSPSHMEMLRSELPAEYGRLLPKGKADLP
jgi:uncharacterized protein (DUF2267 family)